MKATGHEVWVLDDDASIRWVLEQSLVEAGHTVRVFETAEALGQALQADRPAALITDIRLPGESGLDVLAALGKRKEAPPVIVMTAHSDLDSAVSAFEAGAFDYLAKPFDIDELIDCVDRALRARQPETAPPRETRSDADQLIGESTAMQTLYRTIGRLSRSSMSVLITGESGSGKELVARALHRHSPRARGPFIPLNSAAIPGDLLESELFGHERGAFTGAQQRRIGRFEQAHRGTLFLDEIGDMPAALQTRLLRVLAEGEFFRVGGHDPIRVDVRVIAATHQPLEQRVAEGRFREDLYHRLNVVQIRVPPLRERKADIPSLAAHFLEEAGRELDLPVKHLSDAAIRRLQRETWPGNVRQLRNLCRRITALASGGVIHPGEVNEALAGSPNSIEADWTALLRERVRSMIADGQQDLLATLTGKFEAILIDEAMAAADGQRITAARLLGCGRNTLTRKLKAQKP